MTSAPSTNPLISIRFPVPFDRIHAPEVKPAVTELLGNSRTGLDAIGERAEAPTFDNTMRALDTVTEPLDYAMSVVRHLESVATYPELRAVYNAVQPEVAAFYS